MPEDAKEAIGSNDLTMPGVGPMMAVAYVAALERPDTFMPVYRKMLESRAPQAEPPSARRLPDLAHC
jgi:hypothetical protein